MTSQAGEWESLQHWVSGGLETLSISAGMIISLLFPSRSCDLGVGNFFLSSDPGAFMYLDDFCLRLSPKANRGHAQRGDHLPLAAKP